VQEEEEEKEEEDGDLLLLLLLLLLVNKFPNPSRIINRRASCLSFSNPNLLQ
jgi:hypothetical protein